MKITGIVLIFLCLAAAGFMQRATYIKKAKAAEELTMFVSELCTRISFSMTDIGSVIGEIATFDRYKALTFLKPWSDAIKSGISPQKALETVPDTVYLMSECKELLMGLASGLGKSDKQGQITLCESYMERAAALEKETAAVSAEKGKLYLNLCLYAGAFVAVTLI